MRGVRRMGYRQEELLRTANDRIIMAERFIDFRDSEGFKLDMESLVRVILEARRSLKANKLKGVSRELINRNNLQEWNQVYKDLATCVESLYKQESYILRDLVKVAKHRKEQYGWERI